MEFKLNGQELESLRSYLDYSATWSVAPIFGRVVIGHPRAQK